MLQVTISTSNAAFEDDLSGETARIVRQVAERIYRGVRSGACRDVNGNLVGDWTLSEDDPDA